jgi:hypothetical protein
MFIEEQKINTNSKIFFSKVNLREVILPLLYQLKFPLLSQFQIQILDYPLPQTHTYLLTFHPVLPVIFCVYRIFQLQSLRYLLYLFQASL